MGRTDVALSATRVRALKDPGRYSDGGLHLFLGKAGRKSWVLRITIDGRRRNIRLGGYPTVRLNQACEKAADYRAAVAEGRDPLAEKHAPAMPTFGKPPPLTVLRGEQAPLAQRQAHSKLDADPGAPRHADPGQHAPGQDRQVRRAASSNPDLGHTAGDGPAGRQRMRTVFRWPMARGFMDTNPADEAIDGALPPMPKVKAHLRALPYQEVGEVLRTVEASQASLSARLCFRFLVLTAARSGEVRGATRG